MKGLWAILGVAVLIAVAFGETEDPTTVDPLEQDRQQILKILDEYVSAFENADADLMQSLFWIDDDRFVEVENHIREPFGRDHFLWIMDWMRENQEPGWKMLFYDTQLYFLAPKVATTVSMREMDVDGEVTTSRVTLTYLKKGGTWKIIQGHFSFAPE